MSDKKKDLTRIEDLGEFLHDLDGAEDFLPPDLPSDVGEDAPPLFPAHETDVAPSTFETKASIPIEAAFGSSESLSTTENGDLDRFDLHEAPDFLSEDMTPFELSEEPAHEINQSNQLAIETYPGPPTKSVPDISQNDAQMIGEMLAATFDTSLAATSPTSHPFTEASAAAETFEDTRRFGEQLRLDEGSSECNPAFSVMARNIRFLEDSQDILMLLKEAGFPQDMMEQFKRQIERGTLLIPRVSEYTAIYLCHQLRRFRLELSMGLADLIHPPRKGQEGERGLISRRALGQNHQHQFQFKGDVDEARAILLSTLSQIDGHIVERYLGVASEHAFLSAEVVESEATDKIHQSYDELALKLKGHALQSQANAVIGINYQLTPLPDASGLASYRYKLSCTGNLVWLNKLTD